jgi:pyruvate formate lyase activating enzyme
VAWWEKQDSLGSMATTRADGYAIREDDGSLRCGVCPRSCRLAEGRRGVCGVRERRGDQVVSTVYGRVSGVALDPIEKKPLHHVLPGAAALSIGTVGCNLTCDFCQNHHISRAAAEVGLEGPFTPADLVATARRHGAQAVAFTYNEPAVWLEWAIDCAAACRAAGLVTVAVTAGYIAGQARADFFAAMDAANVDLKAFTDGFYRRHCGVGLEGVLDTLRWLRREGRTFVELTTLLIPGENDGEDELLAEFRWIAAELGRDVPLHLSAFHPDYRLLDRPPTSSETLIRARDLALAEGLRFVYLGNLRGRAGTDTICPGCGAVVIGRAGWTIDRWHLHSGACATCGGIIPGIFRDRPGGWRGDPRPVAVEKGRS